MHVHLFKAFDNEDGYITVICHRDRYQEALKSLGFVESVDELEEPQQNERKAVAARAKELGIDPKNKKTKTLLDLIAKAESGEAGDNSVSSN